MYICVCMACKIQLDYYRERSIKNDLNKGSSQESGSEWDQNQSASIKISEDVHHKHY